MFAQLNPPIPLYSLDHGAGLAIACIDYGPDYDLLWVIVANIGGEIWTEPNSRVRGVINYTMGRS